MEIVLGVFFPLFYYFYSIYLGHPVEASLKLELMALKLINMITTNSLDQLKSIINSKFGTAELCEYSLWWFIISRKTSADNLVKNKQLQMNASVAL